MDKKTKLILGGLFIAAGVGLYIWNKNKDKDKDDVVIVAEPIAPTCSQGEVSCPNNPLICYNPNARYERNPCDAAAENIDISSGGIDEGTGNSVSSPSKLNQR